MNRSRKRGSQIIYEVANGVQEDSKTTNLEYPSPFTIDEHRYSSLRKLFRITVYCIKSINTRIWSKCSMSLMERVF